MTVQDILRTKGSDVYTVKPEITVLEAAQFLSERRIGAVVVSTDGKTVDGILSERDLVHALAADGPGVLGQAIATIMTKEVETCTRFDRSLSLMAKMTDGRFRHMPVIENSELCGFVSIGDVVKRRLQEVEADVDAMRDYISGVG